MAYRRNRRRFIIMAGPFFVCGDSGESFRSLTARMVTRYMARFAEPEDISPEEVEADKGFMIYPMYNEGEPIMANQEIQQQGSGKGAEAQHSEHFGSDRPPRGLCEIEGQGHRQRQNRRCLCHSRSCVSSIRRKGCCVQMPQDSFQKDGKTEYRTFQSHHRRCPHRAEQQGAGRL